MTILGDTELLRARWRRYRDGLRLGTTHDDGFATGGLARHIAEVSVRFLVLPADPEAALLRFDDEFWAWWRPEREPPFPGRVSWGHAVHPTGHAAVRHDEAWDDRWAWDTYCALHRSGAFEFALGQAATNDLRGTIVFRLIEIVGRVWAAVNLYGEALDRTEVEGPWQSVLALSGTGGAHRQPGAGVGQSR